MGVCGCYRCDSPCCKELTDYGYICSDCKTEFIDIMKNSNRTYLTPKGFDKHFEKFMRSTPGNFSVKSKDEERKDLRHYFSNSPLC